ncbi:MAG: HAMP domain-containing histidine kinase [Candidatus Eisenbacteria sp.]|nr:HAMP domain-containing histidine kinase [Candidatus Eisenbacteria bacterium]
MRRPWLTWAIFGVCLAVLLLAMGWVTQLTLRLDRERAAAGRRAVTEESIRLALWRMDSGLATLIARESARPYFDYSSFYPAERAYARMFAPLRAGEVLIPSLLLTQDPPHIRLHFQLHPDGALSSPQVPRGSLRDLAEIRFTTSAQIGESSELLAELEPHLAPDAFDGLPEITELDPLLLTRITPPSEIGENESPDWPRRQEESDAQQVRSAAEWQMRALISKQASAQNILNKAVSSLPFEALDYSGETGTIREGLMTPLWIGDLLVLARRIVVDGAEYIQGCWLDWSSIKSWLLPGVRDLFPEADLMPVGPTGDEGQGHRLASLPAGFVPGPVSLTPAAEASPLRISLLIAWICAILAGVAAAVLLRGTVSLGERRAAFVSAVTHELRTPLTTLRMYAEMLAGGMLADEGKRQEYLDTLSREAERLGHLVENVLAYARLEKGSPGERSETLTIASVVDRVRERLAARAEQAGMSLVVEASQDELTTSVHTDPSAVEQILFNLVDNACKYASRAEDDRIHLQIGVRERYVHARVRDHGPGIPPGDARRLFRPFSKSARDAANSAPGVGLGLALSRRLARKMKGDLFIDKDVRDGACFVLTMRRA